MAADIAPKLCDEQYAVLTKRFQEARDYGLTHVEARLFAESEEDIGTLRKLRDGGCPPVLAARILT